MAGRKLWATLEEMTQPDFQGYVADQIVAVFTNNTQRDSEWPSPPNGAVCRSAGVLYTYFSGTGWYKAEQLVTSVSRGTDAGPQGSEADVSGLSVSVTVPSQRKIVGKLTFSRVNMDTASTAAKIRFKEGSTTIWEQQFPCNAALEGPGGPLETTWFTPSAGSHTYKISLEGLGGLATIVVGAGSLNAIVLEIFDVGGA